MATLGIEEDWWLYVVLFAALFILLAINSYIVVIWQHPDDKNEAYFPKAVVVSFGVREARRWSHVPISHSPKQCSAWLISCLRAAPLRRPDRSPHKHRHVYLFFFNG